MSNINQEAHSIYDVIVIGAGLSGLNSAYILRKRCRNLRILIIEAKDRVGGRTCTTELKCSKPNKKSKWDIGGQWVGDYQRNITNLLKELDIETYKQYDDGKKLLESNGQMSIYNTSVPCSSMLSWLDMNAYMKRVDKYVVQLSALYPFSNHTLAKYLDMCNLKNFLYSKSMTPTVRSIFNSNMRTIYGLEISQVNALYGLMYVKSGGGSVEAITYSDDGCAQSKRVKGGTQGISKKLLERLLANSNTSENDTAKIMLSTVVVEVIQNEMDESQPVVVVTQSILDGQMASFKARKIISSIPINQYVRVKFTPELPLFKRSFFKFCVIGNYIKFIITYKRPFWREKGLSGEGTSDSSVMWLNEERFRQAYAKDIGKISFNKQMPTMGAVVSFYFMF
jgi:monoamine oxidase